MKSQQIMSLQVLKKRGRRFKVGTLFNVFFTREYTPQVNAMYKENCISANTATGRNAVVL
jgi:hypothetical protein